jgi:hypothetical protein
LLGHEARGSLLSCLKARGWAHSLEAGIGEGEACNSCCAVLGVHIVLTDAGARHWRDVVQHVFAYTVHVCAGGLALLVALGLDGALRAELGHVGELLAGGRWVRLEGVAEGGAGQGLCTCEHYSHVLAQYSDDELLRALRVRVASPRPPWLQHVRIRRLLHGSADKFYIKQLKVVALSSAEAEYAAASYACREISFIRHVLLDLGFNLTYPAILCIDNRAAIEIAHNLGVTSRNKHFVDAIHYFRHLVDHRVVIPTHVASQFQLADGFTKCLGKSPFKAWLRLLLPPDCFNDM